MGTCLRGALRRSSGDVTPSRPDFVGTLGDEPVQAPVRAAVVHLEGPDRLTTQASAGGRFAWVGVRPGSHRLRVEAEAEASALLTDPFDL